jgi:hypothetical protein
VRAGIFFRSDAKFMYTCSFTVHFKSISACSKMFVKRIICFDEFKEASSLCFQSAPLDQETSLNIKKLKSLHREFLAH